MARRASRDRRRGSVDRRGDYARGLRPDGRVAAAGGENFSFSRDSVHGRIVAPASAGSSLRGVNPEFAPALGRAQVYDGTTDVEDGTAALDFAGHDVGEDWTVSRSRLGNIDDSVAGYLRSLMLRNSIRTARRWVAIVRKFLQLQHIGHVSGLAVDAVEGYLVDLAAAGAAPRTIRNHQTAISGFCEFLRLRDVISVNPARLIRLAKIDESVPIFLDDDEVAQAVAIADRTGVACEVGMALATGLRLGEIRAMAWVDVDLAERSILVRKSKNHCARRVPLRVEAIEHLRGQYERFGHFTWVFPAGRGGKGRSRLWDVNRLRGWDWWKRKALQGLQEQIPKFHLLPRGSVGRGWHLFRHTFATRAVRAGIPLAKVAMWLGHKSLDTTRIYAHYAPGYDPAIERF